MLGSVVTKFKNSRLPICKERLHNLCDFFNSHFLKTHLNERYEKSQTEYKFLSDYTAVVSKSGRIKYSAWDGIKTFSVEEDEWFDNLGLYAADELEKQALFPENTMFEKHIAPKRNEWKAFVKEFPLALEMRDFASAVPDSKPTFEPAVNGKCFSIKLEGRGTFSISNHGYFHRHERGFSINRLLEQKDFEEKLEAAMKFRIGHFQGHKREEILNKLEGCIKLPAPTNLTLESFHL